MSRENLAVQVMRGLDAQVEAERDAGQLALARDRIGVEVAKGGGWTVAVIDVSTLGVAPNGAPYPNDLHGYKFVYCRDGSTPGILLDLDFGGGGRIQTVFPGDVFKGYFKSVAVRQSAQNLVTQGTVKLLLLRSPDVDYDELPPGAAQGQPSLVNTTPAAGNGVTTNVPTTAAQGILLGGVRGVRTFVGASDSNGSAGALAYDAQTGNFTAGQVVTGGTSGATGTIVSDADAGATGTLQLSGVVGTFADNEALTDPLGGAAVVNGTLTPVRTITAGEIHYWLRDPVSGLWAEGPVTETLVTGRNVVVTSDAEIAVPFGRLFAELRGYTEDSGAASPAFVRTEAWGS